MRQAVAEILARHGNHQAQVRQHQLAGGGQVFLVAQATAQLVSRSADSTGRRFTAEMYASIVPSAPGLAMANARALPEAANEVLGCFMAEVSGKLRESDMDSILALWLWEC